MRNRPRFVRDIALSNNAADRYYAASFGKDAAFQREIKPKRERAAPDPTIPSEHQSQSAVVAWWAIACKRYSLPHFALFAIPNGGARDAITGSRLKAEGVRAGILDLMLAVKRGLQGGLFIEMKKRGNYASAEQKEVMHYLSIAGYSSIICHSADEAISAIEAYLSS